MKLLPNPSPGAIWEMPWRYYGNVKKVAIKAGKVRVVEIRPTDYGTSLAIKTPARPFEEFKKLEKAPKDFLKGEQIRGILSISRNPRLRDWDMGRVYHVEDARLWRIQMEALFFTMVWPWESFKIENLPPGRYAAFSMAYVKVVMGVSSATIDLASGRDIEVQMPVPVIEGMGQVGTHTLDRSVRLTKKQYILKELCEIVSAKTESSPQLVVDSAIENESVRLGEGQIVIWDLVERLCAEKGFKLKEMGKKKLSIVPGPERIEN